MPFDSPDYNLGTLLSDVGDKKIQLPDFQREWKWDDDRIASLLATVSLGYPIGVVMMLETGGQDMSLAARPLAGVPRTAANSPEHLLLDGQQRLTSLFQSLKSGERVDTFNATGKQLKRHYFVDIRTALGDDGDREEAILSVPDDFKLRTNFGQTVTADYSTVDLQCASEVFPLSIAYNMPKVFAWNGQYVAGDPDRVTRWNEFFQRVLNNIISYTVPVIVLKKSTPKEAVCTVFEKVNTGGVPLNVFELLTATFAGEKGQDFRLNDDWRARFGRMAAKPGLRGVQNTDFMQAVTLLTTYQRRLDYLKAGNDPAQAPGVSCKRRDILKLRLDDYRRHADAVEAGLVWAATFLAQQHIYVDADVPYRSQLVPLAAIRAALGKEAEVLGADKKLRQWYWCGVLGELYGGAIETRFARDLEQVVDWIRGVGPEPGTVLDASFRQARLLTLRTRNSAAYKGIYALLMREGGMDWMYNKPLGVAAFFDYKVDIHHIFPKAWCEANKIDRDRCESIVNKTALSSTTNQKIGGHSPHLYLPKVQASAGLSEDELDTILRTHQVEPKYLRQADFDGFFADRQGKLLALIEAAMNKPAVREAPGGATDTYEPEQDDLEPEGDQASD